MVGPEPGVGDGVEMAGVVGLAVCWLMFGVWSAMMRRLYVKMGSVLYGAHILT